MSIVAILCDGGVKGVSCLKLAEDIWALADQDVFQEVEIVLSIGKEPLESFEVVFDTEVSLLKNKTSLLANYVPPGCAGSEADYIYDEYKVLKREGDWALVNLDGTECEVEPTEMEAKLEDGVSHVHVRFMRPKAGTCVAVKFFFFVHGYVRLHRNMLLYKEYLLESQLYSVWAERVHKLTVAKDSLVPIQNYYLQVLLPPKTRLESAVPGPDIVITGCADECDDFCPTIEEIASTTGVPRKKVVRSRQFYRWKQKDISDLRKAPISVTYLAKNYTEAITVIAFVLGIVSFIIGIYQLL